MGSRGINKVVLVGNLGAVPEVRYGGNGSAIASEVQMFGNRTDQNERSDRQQRQDQPGQRQESGRNGNQGNSRSAAPPQSHSSRGNHGPIEDFVPF